MMRGVHLYSIFLISLFVCIISGDYLEERKVIYLDRTPESSGINNFLFRGNGTVENFKINYRNGSIIN